MSVEIVKRMTAQLKHNAQRASRAAALKTNIIPVLKDEIQKAANIRSGREKAIDLAREAVEMLEQLAEMDEQSAGVTEAGIGHLIEGVDDLESLAEDLMDNAQVMNMFELWFQANPKIVQDCLELATGFTRQNALQQMDIDKLAEWQQDVNAAIARKGDNA